MKVEIVAALLRSLAERIRSTEGSHTLEVSASEKRALELAARYLDRDAVPEQVLPVAVSLDLSCMRLAEAEEPDTLLCLDFGTAASKAFARQGTDKLLPLEIGRSAGQAEPVFGLTSSVFISDEGKFLFGHQAEQASQSVRASGRRRIDSIKDILAKGDPRRPLGDDLLERDQNPTDVPLREIDILAMYLAYFTDIATTALHETYRKSRYVKRRFSLPVFEPVHSQWATSSLRGLMACAQILADTFHGRWEAGLPVGEVASALRGVRALQAPEFLVLSEGVTEPIAAIASRTLGLAEPIRERQLFAVIDVGAGTIDFALFCRTPEKADDPDCPDKFWVVPGTQKVLRQAGNQVDSVLKQYMLDLAGVRGNQDDFHRIDASLALDVRAFKEALFRGKGTEAYLLVNDKQILVEREKFVQSVGMADLEKQIFEKFGEMLRAAHPSWIQGPARQRLAVLVTGGGADLPIVRSLDGKVLEVGRTMKVELSNQRPTYIRQKFPELETEYPRLAVALGGSSKHLPELPAKQFHTLGVTTDTYVLDVVRKGS